MQGLNTCVCPPPLKPYLSTQLNLCTRLCIRLLNCFVLKILFFKTKQLRSLIQSLIQRFNWVERLGFSSVLQLLAVSTTVIRVRIVLEFSDRNPFQFQLTLETAADNGPAQKRATYVMKSKVKLPWAEYTAWADLTTVA